MSIFYILNKNSADDFSPTLFINESSYKIIYFLFLNMVSINFVEI